MDHPFSDEQIERYVRFPETLTPEVRQAIEVAVEQNQELKEVVSFYREFYREMGSQKGEISPATQAMMDKLFPKGRSEGGETE